MPNRFTTSTGAPIEQPYTYQRYPINMHRGTPPDHQTRVAYSAEEEEAAVAAGWSTDPPKLPEPEIPVVLSTEERVGALEADVSELTAALAEVKEALAQIQRKRGTVPIRAEAAQNPDPKTAA